MKECPNCGYLPTPTNRQRLNLYKKYFPDLPVMEMIKRGWIRPLDEFDMQSVLDALMKFADCKTVEEFKTKFHFEGELMDFD